MLITLCVLFLDIAAAVLEEIILFNSQVGLLCVHSLRIHLNSLKTPSKAP